MKKNLTSFILAGVIAISTFSTALANVSTTNYMSQTETAFMSDLQDAIEASPVLNSRNYEINTIKNTERSANGQVVLTSVDEIVKYLEQQELEQNKYQESLDSVSEIALQRATGDVTKTIKYTRSLITKYVLSATVKVNKNTGIISKISSPRLTLTGGYGISLENQSYDTEIIGDTIAYVACDYTNVSKIKVPGVIDVEVQRKDYHTYMYYQYDTVYDYGNDEL